MTAYRITTAADTTGTTALHDWNVEADTLTEALHRVAEQLADAEGSHYVVAADRRVGG